MQFKNYGEITATPQAQVEFLELVQRGFEGREKPDETLAAFLKRTVEVAGKPFSQVDHLRSLEDRSGDWDLDEVPLELKTRLAGVAEALHQADRGYDLPHFITGFEAMVMELKGAGVEIEYEAPKKERGQDNVGVDHGL